MVNILSSLYHHLSHKRRVQLFLVLALMLMGTVAEVFTLGAIVPFLGLLVNPGVADQHPMVGAALDVLAPIVGGTRLAAASLWFALFAVLAAVLRLTLNWASLRFVFAVGADFGEEVFSRVLQQPYTYHLQRNSSQMLAAVDKVGSVVMGFMAPLMQAGIGMVMVVAIFCAMVFVNPALALGAGLVFGTLYVGISLWAKQRLRKNGQVIADNGTLKIKAMQEGLGAIRDVIIDGNHAVYTRHFSQADRVQRRAQAVNSLLAGSPKYVVESIGMVLFVLMALWLVSGPGGAAQAVPTLGALALAAQRLLPYMQTIYNGLASARGNIASTEEILHLLNLPEQTQGMHVEKNKMSYSESETFPPVIEMRNVCFSYTDRGNNVLQDINFSIKPQRRVGIVGATGSGKSTLVDLIMGLLQPSSGEIYIDGVLLTSSNLRIWQMRIAHVPQSIFLTDSSIAENIAFAVPKNKMDMALINDAIAQAQLSDVISDLPDGIYTRVGERGVQLSGGQRQRIGIARALYKKADVLILDEATSALDDLTESKLMEAIYSLNPNMVLIMIAHRTSTLKKCDEIIKVSQNSVNI